MITSSSVVYCLFKTISGYTFTFVNLVSSAYIDDLKPRGVLMFKQFRNIDSYAKQDKELKNDNSQIIVGAKEHFLKKLLANKSSEYLMLMYICSAMLVDLGMSSNTATIISKRKLKHKIENFHYISLCKCTFKDIIIKFLNLT